MAAPGAAGGGSSSRIRQVQTLLHDRMRAAERIARLPANSFPFVFAGIFLLVLLLSQANFLSSSSSQEVQLQALKVERESLKAEVEELQATEQAEQGQVLQLKARVSDAEKVRNELQVKQAEWERQAAAAAAQAAALRREIVALLETLAKAKNAAGAAGGGGVAGGAAVLSGAAVGGTDDDLATRFNATISDVRHARAEHERDLGVGAAGSTVDVSSASDVSSGNGALAVSLLNVRMGLDVLQRTASSALQNAERTVAQAKSDISKVQADVDKAKEAADKAKADVDRAKADAEKAKADAEAAAGGGKAVEECKALLAKRESVKQGKLTAEAALEETTELAFNLSARGRAWKQVAAARVGELQQVLSDAAKRSPADVKSVVEKAAATCKLAVDIAGVSGPVGASRGAAPAAAAGKEALGGMCSRGGACNATEAELARYFNFTEGQECPEDWFFVQELIFGRGCHCLPRRRCFARNFTSYQEPMPLPGSLWNESALMDTNVRWGTNTNQSFYGCDSFGCLRKDSLAVADCPDCFNYTAEAAKFFSSARSQIPLDKVLLAKNGTLRIGLDLGGGSGSFAAVMAQHNVTVMTTGLNLETIVEGGEGGDGLEEDSDDADSGKVKRNVTKRGVPYMEAVAMRGLIPLYLPHNARLPFFDGTLDFIHASSSVDVASMSVDEFLDAFYEWDRVLRPGGLIWFGLLYSQVRAMPPYMDTVEMFKYKFLHRTVSPLVRPDGLHVFVNFVIEKPRERDFSEPPPPPFE